MRNAMRARYARTPGKPDRPKLKDPNSIRSCVCCVVCENALVMHHEKS